MQRTELKALVAYGIYTGLTQLGVPSEQIEEATSSLPELVQGFLGGNSTANIVLGVVVSVYIWARTKRKNIKDSVNLRRDLSNASKN